MGNVHAGKAWAEKQAFPEEDITFQERVEKVMGRIENIMDNVAKGDVARALLAEHGLEAISRMKEEDLEPLVGDHDPAVIVALCRALEEKSRLARKELH